MTNTASPAIPLKEFDAEMASTRRLLERVPATKEPGSHTRSRLLWDTWRSL